MNKKLSDFVGKTPVSVVTDDGKNELVFTFDDQTTLRFYHQQDCCESVWIDDITGDLNDLVGVPLLMCEETSGTPPAREDNEDDWQYGSETWTFYKFASIKGYVDVRWCGTSNGYYSESVDWEYS